jgi:hypothetical protein
MNPIDELKSVLCDPEGKCCIAGSEEDRAIIDRALKALTEPAVETDDPLHCDICGDATDDPWHFSTSQDRHKHACDKCWESKKALRAASAEPVPEPMRKHVEDFAAKGGWTKDSGEGAFEFVQRISYAQGVEDGRNRPAQTPPAEPRISTEHCSLAERQRHQASVNYPSDDLYCPRCQCSEKFLNSKVCDPHIVYGAPPPPPAEVPLLTTDDIRKVADKADEGQEPTEFMLAFARAI